MRWLKKIETSAHFLLFLGATAFVQSAAFAQTDIYVRGAGSLYPIALPQLCLDGGPQAVAVDIPEVMTRDLDISGYFKVLSPGAFIEKPGNCRGPDSIVYSDWSVVGAEGLVRGVVSQKPDGRILVKMYLYDVQRRAMVLGKEYEGEPGHARRIAHRFANEIFKFFTGEAGVFGSQISFTSRVGRFKELFTMDMDGSNVRQLTNDRALALASAWDSKGKQIVFTSYRNRQPDLFIIDPETKKSTQVTRGPALEIGAQFTRSGSSLLTSRSLNGKSELVYLGLNGSENGTLLRPDDSINVSPRPSPDEQSILFCSNRGGGPQIYSLARQGGSPRRISFANSNYCTSPAWSPKGDRIAFVCRANRGFQIYLAKPDGSETIQLTGGGDNEDPDFSPDGRFLVYSTTTGAGGLGLAIARTDGTHTVKISGSRGGDSDPSWGQVPQ